MGDYATVHMFLEGTPLDGGHWSNSGVRSNYDCLSCIRSTLVQSTDHIFDFVSANYDEQVRELGWNV